MSETWFGTFIYKVLPNLICFFLGYMTYDHFDKSNKFVELSEEYIADLVIAGLSYVIKTKLEESRVTEQKIQTYYRKISSQINAVAVTAIENLKLEEFKLGPKHGILEKSSFRYANWRNADLSNFSFKKCDLIGVDFTGAILDNCNFYKSNLSNEQINSAKSLENCILPGGDIFSLNKN